MCLFRWVFWCIVSSHSVVKAVSLAFMLSGLVGREGVYQLSCAASRPMRGGWLCAGPQEGYFTFLLEDGVVFLGVQKKLLPHGFSGSKVSLKWTSAASQMAACLINLLLHRQESSNREQHTKYSFFPAPEGWAVDANGMLVPRVPAYLGYCERSFSWNASTHHLIYTFKTTLSGVIFDPKSELGFPHSFSAHT